MVVRIRNLLTAGPLLVPLNSGATVRLSPGQLSDDLHEVEVIGNEKIDKLRRQRVLDVVEVKAQADAGGAERGSSDSPADSRKHAASAP
jgi:hypothetical protein